MPTVAAAQGMYLKDDFVTNVLVTVVDFQTHTTAVVRAMEYFKAHARPSLGTLQDLNALLSRYADDQQGNTALAQRL